MMVVNKAAQIFIPAPPTFENRIPIRVSQRRTILIIWSEASAAVNLRAVADPAPAVDNTPLPTRSRLETAADVVGE